MSLGLLGAALALAAFALKLSLGVKPAIRIGIAIIALAAAFLTPGAAFLRGLAGDISVTSMVFLGVTVLALAGGPELRSRKELGALGAFVLVSALTLYPMALGLTRFDPYSLGYTRSLLWPLGAILFLAWVSGRYLLLAALVLALAAFQLRLLESSNLWDYLLDPWILLAVLVGLASRFTIFGRLSKSR